MPIPILTTKLFIPPPRPKAVNRPRLIERLNEGLPHSCGVTLISAPAGFGKTTLVSEWAAGPTACRRSTAWLSLDERDNDPRCFLTYLIAALQQIVPNFGAGLLGLLQSPQPPATESVLTALLNEITAVPDAFTLVLDDYHIIEAKPVDAVLAFLLENLPPQLRLVIVTREEPRLPLARLRVRGQLTEVRAADLRFTPSEAAGFLNRMMGLNLAAEDIALLSARTEGWIAGLQLAALALQGLASSQEHQDASGFIQSFTGSHRFVMDYLIEEVLQQQPESIQTFLLRTAILTRMCGSLCDAVCSAGTEGNSQKVAAAGQETLEYLERANLFIVPLDNERRWYRYHHLFADLLRQRLGQSVAASGGAAGSGAAELHIRASIWYEDNGLDLEALHHAAAAKDVERAARLVEGKGMPLHFRGAVTPVLNWLESLPRPVLDAKPALWVTYASALSMTGQTAGVEVKLQAAEAALQGCELDSQTRNLIGHIAAIRALLAATQHQVEAIITQSQRALEYLRPDNLPVRTATMWKMGLAYQLQGDRAAAGRAYTEAIAISRASGNAIINLTATIGLANVRESENQLFQAAADYQYVLELIGETLQPAACEAHLGLARILYQWNDLDAAERHARQSLQLARQLGNTDRVVAGEVLLARLKLARGDAPGAAAVLADAGQVARRHNFVLLVPEVAAAQVVASLRQGNLVAAAHLAQADDLPLSQARIRLARGEAGEALTALEPLCRRAEAKDWKDERLKVMVLQAVALRAHGEKDKAVQRLDDALALAEPGKLIRVFLDEGAPLEELLAEAAALRIRPDYLDRLRAGFEAETRKNETKSAPAPALIEPLSQRELEVLRLIARGFSNQEISEGLFLALDTVKGHNRRIFEKLQVQRRTEAVARARELGLL